MATARQLSDLRRWANLTVIQRALEAKLPDIPYATAGLKDVAVVCGRDYGARPGRDCNGARDQLLLIGVEWDLAHDRLDRQSDACLGAIADFLR
jgi:hypothetical protein